MSFEIRDKITPALAKAAKGIHDKRPILEAMGLAIVSITQRAFSDSALRPKPWPARKKPAPHSLLRKSGALWHSIRISELSNESVTVGSDRVYAAIQQFGSSKKSGRGSGIPARPFFPFIGQDKLTPIAAEKVKKAALVKIAKLLGK